MPYPKTEYTTTFRNVGIYHSTRRTVADDLNHTNALTKLLERFAVRLFAFTSLADTGFHLEEFRKFPTV